MNWRAPLTVLILAASSRGQTGLLEEARQTALNYSRWLPDFICTEVIRRYEGYSPTGAFRSTDILTLQLTYFQLHENYKLVARNGHPTRENLESLGGAFTEGEFGSTLLLIFHPDSKAEFAFRDWSTLRGRRVAVYTYRVERVNSRFQLRVASDSVIAGYHGEVHIDIAAHLVLRIEDIVDVPDGFPVQSSSNTGDYDFVNVGGHRYLLPARWESLSADLPALHSAAKAASGTTILHPWDKPPYPVSGRAGGAQGSGPQLANQMRYRNVIEFRDYRKYATESTLTFDAPVDPSKPKPGPPKQ